ncbi:MAG: hypothetical protein U0517_03990 [Candidatus Andersenbacteria bacterium]
MSGYPTNLVRHAHFASVAGYLTEDNFPVVLPLEEHPDYRLINPGAVSTAAILEQMQAERQRAPSLYELITWAVEHPEAGLKQWVIALGQSIPGENKNRGYPCARPDRRGMRDLACAWERPIGRPWGAEDLFLVVQEPPPGFKLTFA